LNETYEFEVDDVDDAALLELAESINGLPMLEVQNVRWPHRETGHWRKPRTPCRCFSRDMKLSATQKLLHTFLSRFMIKERAK